MSTHTELRQQLKEIHQVQRKAFIGIAKQAVVAAFQFEFRFAARKVKVLAWFGWQKTKLISSRVVRSRCGLIKLKHTCKEE